MDETGKKLTETEGRKIVIVVREDDFDVLCDSTLTTEEIFQIFVACAQHIEENFDDPIVYQAPTMLQ